MKPNAFGLKSVVVAVALGAATALMAQRAPAGGAAKPGAGKGAAVADAKKEPEPKIAGIVLNRPKGGFLGLTLENNNFKLSFYDAKKKPTQVDMVRATARWPVHYKIGDERTVLLPSGDGKALVSAYYVRPPHAFKLYLSLFAGDGDGATESYVIDFHE